MKRLSTPGLHAAHGRGSTCRLMVYVQTAKPLIPKSSESRWFTSGAADLREDEQLGRLVMQHSPEWSRMSALRGGAESGRTLLAPSGRAEARSTLKSTLLLKPDYGGSSRTVEHAAQWLALGVISSSATDGRLGTGGGGEGGIRTHGTREGTTVFETVPIDHSGTSPHSRSTPPRGRRVDRRGL